MATGPNTTGSFADSMDDIVAGARTVREYANVMSRLVDTTRLKNNTGMNWKEVVLSRLTASNLDELTDLEQNPQLIIDSLFTIAPTLVGLSVFMTDRARVRISSVVAAKIGVLTENALARKIDLDMVAVGAAATTDLGTAGNPFSSDAISAAASRVADNSTEPWDGPMATVARGFQIKDIQDEGVAGFGTYPVPEGLTERWLRKGFSGDLFDTAVYKDNNIVVDSADDAVAFVFASGPGGAIVNITGMESRHVTVRKENIGGGAEIMYVTDEYGLGLRQSAHIIAITADSTAPTA